MEYSIYSWARDWWNNMIGIISKEVKQQLKENLKANSSEVDTPENEILRIQDLESIFKISREARTDSKKEVKEKLGTELSIVNLHITCCFLMTVSIPEMTHEIEEAIFPKSWSRDVGFNPDNIFKTLITQLTQHSISIVELVSAGLDGSARVLSRSTADLAWQILILLAFKKDLSLFVSAQTSEDITKTWYELFAKGRTQKKLIEIEKMLDIHSEVIERLAAQRKDDHQFFSESVHSGYAMAVVGTINWSFEEDAGAWSAFGGASSASRGTIAHLAQTLGYFCEIFILILNDIHHIYPDIKIESWRQFLLLQESIKDGIRRQD